FRPEGEMLSPDKLRVLIVGHHMRDWVVIHRTIDEINRRALDVEFHAVTVEYCFPYFTGCAALSERGRRLATLPSRDRGRGGWTMTKYYRTHHNRERDRW